MNKNLPPFYVGQRVVALKSSKDRKVKKGNVYTVAFCVKNGCNHGSGWDIGVKERPAKLDYSDCCQCHGRTYHHNFFFMCGGSEYFAPITENFQSITLEKVLETETSLIGAN